jgi:F-type H+-transporting ATPase subunit b
MTLLGAFARGPIVEAMKKRQEQVLENLRQADLAAQESKRLMQEHAREREKLKARADELRRLAIADVERIRKESAARAAEEIESQRRRTEREIQLAKQKAVVELWRTATDQSTQLADRFLHTGVDAADHDRLIEQAIADVDRRLQEVA